MSDTKRFKVTGKVGALSAKTLLLWFILILLSILQKPSAIILYKLYFQAIIPATNQAQAIPQFKVYQLDQVKY
ncbi:hypothetical protein DXT99_25250 [Pontibacter diazotrophicus]|uniref:Uncharacterized protein n=1 Tax=Pontibacter diazotrophicus TaxID=1400979 RepID=A0A3D8L175_9BACT|nr:hypothetical protein [Pontibacter diazotrophicus]RDV11123.1 hypothetical protein DXT99_25250 [Pontibacter diazotrophicus]